MRIAHLILAHQHPMQVKRMINAMDHPNFDFYIHVDAKVDQRPFEKILKSNNVHFITKRSKVYWGDWGTIQATLNGFEELPVDKHDYVNVISGQDFPIKSAAGMLDFFKNNYGKEFITCEKPEGEWADARTRIEEYHFINWRFPGRHRLEKLTTTLLPRRRFPLDYQLVGRANWFTLTKHAVRYAVDFLKSNPSVVHYFKLCWGADEFIFSTILYNSEFRDRIQDNLVYVDWNSGVRGHPKLLDINDYMNLVASPKLFARKFDTHIDDSLMNAIEKKILAVSDKSALEPIA